TFEHAVNASTVTADVLAPTATMNATMASLNSGATVTGTASDENGAVSQARLYDGTTLIASSDAAEQSAAVSALSFTNGGVNWSAGWMPTTAGAHELTFIASDAAGNETKVEQTVTVSAATTTSIQANAYDYPAYVLAPGETRRFTYTDKATFNLNTNQNYYISQYIFHERYWNGSGSDCTTDGSLTISVVDAATGEAITTHDGYASCYAGAYVQNYYGTLYGNQELAHRNMIFIVKNNSSVDQRVFTYLEYGTF
ncbi:hypothetical protein ACFO0D_13055, partial [Deinococcus hohokamensis]